MSGRSLGIAALLAALGVTIWLGWVGAIAASCRNEVEDGARKLQLCDRALAANDMLPLPDHRSAVLVAHRGAALSQQGRRGDGATAMARAIAMTGPRQDRVQAITSDLTGQSPHALIDWAMARARAGLR